MAYRNQLEDFELPNVKFTGERLSGGTGSYGYVEIVLVAGTRCAAKLPHQIFEQYALEWKKSPLDYFRAECTLMSKLRHPHIVQFLGLCYPERQQAKLPALVMELLMTDLHEYLETESLPVALSNKHSILLGVSKGLLYLHSMDVVHRDLTARNVLLSDSLMPKIADLGMARLLDLQAGKMAATMTKGPGNTNYMPPEAKDDDHARYGKPIDCFSMGHLILFTVTQQFPKVLGSTYYNERIDSLIARSEVERREESFNIVHRVIGRDHTLTQLARECLHVRGALRPTAADIMERLQTMPISPYGYWEMSKCELVNKVLKQEDLINKLQTELSTKQALIERLGGDISISHHQLQQLNSDHNSQASQMKDQPPLQAEQWPMEHTTEQYVNLSQSPRHKTEYVNHPSEIEFSYRSKPQPTVGASDLSLQPDPVYDEVPPKLQSPVINFPTRQYINVSHTAEDSLRYKLEPDANTQQTLPAQLEGEHDVKSYHSDIIYDEVPSLDQSIHTTHYYINVPQSPPVATDTDYANPDFEKLTLKTQSVDNQPNYMNVSQSPKPVTKIKKSKSLTSQP